MAGRYFETGGFYPTVCYWVDEVKTDLAVPGYFSEANAIAVVEK